MANRGCELKVPLTPILSGWCPALFLPRCSESTGVQTDTPDDEVGQAGGPQEPLTEAGRQSLRPNTEYLLAVHCHQTDGGQYIDVGIYEKIP